MGFANPTLGIMGWWVKMYNFCRSISPVITAVLTDTSGLDPSRLVVTVDGGWLGIEINLTILYYHMGIGTVH